MVVSLDGRRRTLETTGMPLGLISYASFPAVETMLAPGDKVVIYSDGVTEARGQGAEFYGVDRLSRVIEKNAAAPWDQLHDAILEDVQAFTKDTPQADDVTLVVLEYRR